MKNLKRKEQQLNQTLSEYFTSDEILDRYIYLTNPSRGKHTTRVHLLRAWRENRLGTLLRKLDPIAFNCE